MGAMKDKPEGILETTWTQDNCRFALEYKADKYGYHVGTRFEVFAAHLSLELGKAMIAAIGMVASSEVPAIIKHVRTEYKRLEFRSFNPPAQKQWAIIHGAINRLEGKRVRSTKRIEIWS